MGEGEGVSEKRGSLTEREREMFYLTTHSTHFLINIYWGPGGVGVIWKKACRQETLRVFYNRLFNDTLNTF